MTDGALFVVGIFEDISPEVERQLMLAMAYRVRPILCINNVEKYFELEWALADAAAALEKILERVNGVISSYTETDLDLDWSVSAKEGSVIFASTEQSWAFTAETGIMTALEKVKTLDGQTSHGEGRLSPAMIILSALVKHVPSPKVAQPYRCQALYTGPADDETCCSGMASDSENCLMLYIGQIVPVPGGETFALGRVFGGTIGKPFKCCIQGPNYQSGGRVDRAIKSVQKVRAIFGHDLIDVGVVTAGNLVAISGIDQYLGREGTLTTSETAHNFRMVKQSTVSVVQCSVQVEDSEDQEKLVQALKELVESDKSVTITRDQETDVSYLCATSESHLKLLSQQLRKDVGVPLRVSESYVMYRETVQQESSQQALAKSPNKMNRVYTTARPLDEKTSAGIEAGELDNIEPGDRAYRLQQGYGWSREDGNNIWAFGTEKTRANALINQVSAHELIDEAKVPLIQGFETVLRQGPLCEEPLRSVRFNLTDLFMHNEPAKRPARMLLPAARRSMYAAMLLARPRIMESMYLVEMMVAEDAIGQVYSVMNRRRGSVFAEDLLRESMRIFSVKGYLPVGESRGFMEDLRDTTRGKAIAHLSFGEWETMRGDPLDVNGKLWQDVVRPIRVRKGRSLRNSL